MGDWAMSAGTDAETSEYVVLDIDDWTSLGSHSNEVVEVCDYTEVTLNIADSYGDGWDTGSLTVGDLTFTLNGVDDDGSSATFDLCLEDGAYAVTCGGSSWNSEISWEMLAADGTVLLAGGAPYEGFLQIGEPTDVLGCTDPEALNYDETATLDDGSCVYAGETCATALDAVAGTNDANGATQWFSYTSTLTGTMTISSQNASGDAAWDTNLEVYSDCETVIAANDDDFGYFGPSRVVLDVIPGTVYLIAWLDSYSPGPFEWTIEEAYIR